MRPLLPWLILPALSTAHAEPNAPLVFRLEPAQYHAYRSDPPPPLTLTLFLSNPTSRPVTLTCRSTGGPVLKRFTEYQDFKPVNVTDSLGHFQPVGPAPTCSRVGQTLTLPAHARYTYTRALGPQRPGVQLSYAAGWHVSLRPGFSWLSRAHMLVVVVNADRPVPTSNPQAYRVAIAASGATIYTAGSGTGRLRYGVADEASRQAMLAELKKRALDPNGIDIEVAPPVTFPPAPTFPHTARVDVRRSPQGHVFTLTVTNRSGRTVEGGARSACEPAAIDRVVDGVRVWQVGNGPCISLGMPRVPLAPGASVTRTLTWDGRDSLHRPVPAGTYRVTVGQGQFTGTATFTVNAD
ncbi:hypothetical protein [Deinococcus ficus]|uniref:hypothetical protein n=1 Tax=Deinococcus ficus TaxID=317577 RepID=UPI0003B4E947|nr:hypothetical protein [Deinococcus ficus]